MAKVVYRLAPEIEQIAKPIIDKHHPHLRGVRIDYVWRSKAGKVNGKTAAGYAKKMTGLNALLATEDAEDSEDLDFFVVVIAEDIWMLLNPEAQQALVDHELTHCQLEPDDDGGVILRIAPHDIEEFGSIARRHGRWNPALEYFVSQLDSEQLEFGGTGPASPSTGVGVAASGPDETF